MELQGISTTSMMIDPKSEDATKRFFKLINKKAENYKVDTDALVRYILLMYDASSPLIEFVDDYWSRKYEALEAAGFKQRKGKYNDEIERFILGRNEAVTDLIIDFLIQTGKPTWNHIVFLNEALIRYTKQAQSSDKMSPGDVKAVSDIMTNMSKAVKEFSIEIETKDFLDRFYYKAHQELIKVRPEDYAKKLVTGDTLDDDSPYGKYKVDRIKFAGKKIPDEEV